MTEIALSGALTDDELLLLCTILIRRRPTPFDGYIFGIPITPFNLDDYDDAECKHLFRFRRADILRLRCVLGIPDEIRCYNGSVFDGLDGLCLVLRRLAFPVRYYDLLPMFARSQPELSMLFQKTLRIIYNRNSWALDFINLTYLDQERIQLFANAVQQMGVPTDSLWAFIDGSDRKICRPSILQGEMYSGHKRLHAIKFQSLLTPDGIIVDLAGPYSGRRHDATMLYQSNFLHRMDEKLDPFDSHYFIYGDPGYPIRRRLMSPYRGAAHLDPKFGEFNKAMARVRQPVEWGFCKVTALWESLSFSRLQRVLSTAPGRQYAVAVLLTNAHTCVYGSQTGAYFGATPPSLEEYFLHD